MAGTELRNKQKWDVILIIISCVLTAILTLITGKFLAQQDPVQSKTTIQNTLLNIPGSLSENKVSQKTSNLRHKVIPSKQASAPLAVATSTNIPAYIEVYLNVNSNDQVLVDGKAASAEQIANKPSTLKLLAGKKYLIKINNCPEIEIISSKDLSVSTCM